MPSFVLEIFHLFDIKDFHTGKLRFPVVIADFRDTGFDGLQYGNDLMLGESSFTRGEFLRGHNQFFKIYWCGVKGGGVGLVGAFGAGLFDFRCI